MTKAPLAKMGKIRGKSGLGEEIQELRHRGILKIEPIKRRRITNQGQARVRGVPREAKEERRWLRADAQRLPRKPGRVWTAPSLEVTPALAQRSGSQPARLLVGLLPVFIGPFATSEVLPLQRQEGPGKGSVPSEHQMGHIALNRQWPQGEKWAC